MRRIYAMNNAERARYDEMLDAGGVSSLDRCPVCEDGDEDNLPCSDECGDAQLSRVRQQRIERCYDKARFAVKLARVYRNEDGPGGYREKGCHERIFTLRTMVKVTRAAQRIDDKRAS